jgi:hypothetical protein
LPVRKAPDSIFSSPGLSTSAQYCFIQSRNGCKKNARLKSIQVIERFFLKNSRLYGKSLRTGCLRRLLFPLYANRLFAPDKMIFSPKCHHEAIPVIGSYTLIAQSV